MPNRKITEFPSIEAGDIVDQDVLTLVDVFEVDPALRNKKITFTEFRNYLDTYYVNTTEIDPFEVGNLLVSGYLSVSGTTTLESNLTVSGLATFESGTRFLDDVNISNDLTVTGNIVATQITIDNTITDYLQAVSGNFSIATGITADFSSGYFDTLSGTTITGEAIGGVSGTFVDLTVPRGLVVESGWFEYLNASNLIATGIVVTTGTFTSGIQTTGTISGGTITGDTGNFGVLNTTSGYFDFVSGTFITGDTGEYDSLTAQSLTGVSGNIPQLVSLGIHTNTLTGTTANINVVSGSVAAFTTGTFQGVSGTTAAFGTVTGTTADFNIVNADAINVDTLNATNLSFSGDQTISGNFVVQQNATISGSGIIEQDLYVGGTITGDTVTGTYGYFTNLSGYNISGYITRFNQIYVTNRIVNSGLLVQQGTTVFNNGITATGDLRTSGDIIGDGDTNISGINNIYFESGNVSGLVVRGDLNVEGSATLAELFFSGDLTISGNLDVTENITATGNVTATTGIFTTVTGTTAEFTSGVFNRSLAATAIGTNLSYVNVTGTTITGTDVLATNGTFVNITGTTVTGTDILATNGTFVNITGTTITGETISATTGVFNSVDIQNFSASDLTVSGQLIASGLIVQDTATVSGGLNVISGQAAFPWGTSGEPGVTFTGDLNTGFYNEGEKVNTSCDGNRAMTIESGTGGSAGRFVLTIWSA